MNGNVSNFFRALSMQSQMIDVELNRHSPSLFHHHHCGPRSIGEDNPVSQHAGKVLGTVDGDEAKVIICRVRFDFEFNDCRTAKRWHHLEYLVNVSLQLCKVLGLQNFSETFLDVCNARRMIDMLEECGKTVDPHRLHEVFVRLSELSLNLSELKSQLVDFGPSVGTVVSPLNIQRDGGLHLP